MKSINQLIAEKTAIAGCACGNEKIYNFELNEKSLNLTTIFIYSTYIIDHLVKYVHAALFYVFLLLRPVMTCCFRAIKKYLQIRGCAIF
jgi:hypothetical protein